MEFDSATSNSPWHIRQLTEAGKKMGGGIDTPSLCGRKQNGWDVNHRAPEQGIKPDFVCESCWAEFMLQVRDSNATGYTVNKYGFEHHYFDCTCQDSSHVLRFTLDLEEGDIWTENHLRHTNPWYKRIWLAIKYIFGYQSKYGAFDCVTLEPPDYDRLRKLLDKSEKILASQPKETNQ